MTEPAYRLMGSAGEWDVFFGSPTPPLRPYGIFVGTVRQEGGGLWTAIDVPARVVISRRIKRLDSAVQELLAASSRLKALKGEEKEP